MGLGGVCELCEGTYADAAEVGKGPRTPHASHSSHAAHPHTTSQDAPHDPVCSALTPRASRRWPTRTSSWEGAGASACSSARGGGCATRSE